tara:strand:+ start:689 stop:946 length:258 start_codon:yes stop_codon:yes gene_type:complete
MKTTLTKQHEGKETYADVGVGIYRKDDDHMDKEMHEPIDIGAIEIHESVWSEEFSYWEKDDQTGMSIKLFDHDEHDKRRKEKGCN